MIFIEDPYFNEPSYEAIRGTSEGASSSLKYNSGAQPGCTTPALYCWPAEGCSPAADKLPVYWCILQEWCAMTVLGLVL